MSLHRNLEERKSKAFINMIEVILLSAALYGKVRGTNNWGHRESLTKSAPANSLLSGFWVLGSSKFWSDRRVILAQTWQGAIKTCGLLPELDGTPIIRRVTKGST